ACANDHALRQQQRRVGDALEQLVAFLKVDLENRLRRHEEWSRQQLKLRCHELPDSGQDSEGREPRLPVPQADAKGPEMLIEHGRHGEHDGNRDRDAYTLIRPWPVLSLWPVGRYGGKSRPSRGWDDRRPANAWPAGACPGESPKGGLTRCGVVDRDCHLTLS